MSSNEKLFFGGVPTAPDVTLLLEAIPPDSMEPGSVYTHADLASVFTVSPKSNRYRSVVAAWRNKILQDHNIDITAEIGVGYRVLKDDERITHGVRDAKGARKKLTRAAHRIDRADRSLLTDAQRKQADHAVRLFGAQALALRGAEKEVSSAGKVVSLPRKKA